MSKIFLKGKIVWDKNRLPDEREALKLVGKYVKGDINPEVLVALSSGIDAIVDGMRFNVVLNNEGVQDGTRNR